MCNIIFVNSRNYINQNVSKDLLKTLKIRGRDNYSFLNISNNNEFLYASSNFDNFSNVVNSIKYKTAIFHSRAIPETEKKVDNMPNIYTNNNKIYVAHHGIIPNAELYDKNIIIDSQLLLKIYENIDYENIEEWFIESIINFPRATSEIIYDKRYNKIIIATTFMPMYYYSYDNIEIYSTYRINDMFLTIPSYTIDVIDI